MTLNITVLSERLSATQVISFVLPCSQISNSYCSVNLIDYQQQKRSIQHAGSASFLDNLNMDFLILSRFTLKLAETSVNHCKSHNLPVAFHIDDLLVDVPPEIGSDKYDRYTSVSYRSELMHILNSVDIIISSTPRLTECLAKYGFSNIRTMPLYRCSLEDYPDHSCFDNLSPIIGYMGTRSHQVDLETIVPSIKQMMLETPSLQFQTFGCQVPYELSILFPDRVKSLSGVNNYNDFLSKLSSLGWWIGLAPLLRSRFNSCKAPTKWVEYTEAGIPCIAENFGPYSCYQDSNCIALCDTQSDWYLSMRMLLENRFMRESVVRSAKEIQTQRMPPMELIDFYANIYKEFKKNV